MATPEKMYDLEIEFLDDGRINLAQDSGCGEMVKVFLHPAQVRLIAERAGLATALPATIDSDLMVSQLKAIRDQAGALFEFLAGVPSFPPRDDEDEDVARARMLFEALDRLCAVEAKRETTTLRRFKSIVNRLNALANNRHYLDEILERCGSGNEYLTELSALCDLANEYLHDLTECEGND